MFYLTKRVDEKQCTIGERCMVLADFSGVPAGTRGKVIEVYDEGVTIEWLPCINCAPGKDCGGRPTRDGFGRDELEYLAFETKEHPRFDPKVSKDI
jgi:hypothetical protein